MRKKVKIQPYAFLSVLMIGIIGLTVGIGVVSLRYIETQLMEATGKSLALAATDIAGELDLFLTERYRDITMMAQAKIFQDRNVPAMTAYFNEEQEAYQDYLWLGATDAGGRLIAATDPASVGKDRSQTPWFQTVRDGGRPYLQDAAITEESDGIMAVLLAAPIMSAQGKFLGAVTVQVGLPAIEDILMRTAMALQAQHGTAVRIEYQFLRHDVLLIADSRLREEGGANLKQLGLPSALLVNSGPPGFVEEEHLRRHVPVVTGYAQVRETGALAWGVLIRMDRDDILAQVNTVMGRLAVAGAFVLGPLLGLLLWTVGRLKKEWVQVQERNTALQSLMEAERELAADLDVERLSTHLLQSARTLTGARYAALCAFDETQERLTKFLTAGLDGATKQAIGKPPTGRGLLGWLAQEDGVVRLKDLTQHPASVGFPTHHPPMRSFLGMPIRARGRLFGLIYLTEKQRSPHEFTELDEQTLVALVIQAETAIEKALSLKESQAAEAKYRLLLESTAEGIWGMDMEGRCMFMNKAATRMLGYHLDEVLGRKMHELVHHAYPDGSPYPSDDCPILHALQTGTAVCVTDEILLRRDGTSFPADMSSHPMVEKGVGKGTVVAFCDITERKQMENQFRQAQKLGAVGQLTGGIAHDFNNLLTVINGYSEMTLQLLKADDPLRPNLEQIKEAGERAAALTRQLLAFSRKQMLKPKVLDLNAVVTNIERMLTRTIGEDIDLVATLMKGLGRVKADPDQIEQVIMNLAVNARDAMPQGGKLTIETANVELDENFAQQHVVVQPGRYVMLAVSDTGCGMDMETQKHIFEPFFTTKERGKGTGLGLATVYGIVKQSGGSIWFYSEVGKGTTFKIYLPRVEEEVESLLPVGGRTKAVQGSETIMLVEDDEAVRDLIYSILQSNGYTVLVAGDGSTALQIGEQHRSPIHLMISDVVMPGMDGRELAGRLVAHHLEMKVLFMSGYTDDTVLRHGISEQSLAFLQKPFTADSLLRKVREVLDASGHENQFTGLVPSRKCTV